MPRLSRARHHSSLRVSLARSGTHNRPCSDPYGLVRLPRADALVPGRWADFVAQQRVEDDGANFRAADIRKVPKMAETAYPG